VGKDFNLLKAANKAYRDKQFERAIKLYEQAAQVYGEHIVELNIKTCQKHLRDNDSKSGKLDAITQLLLDNSGKIKLSNSERGAALARYEALQSKKSEPLPVKPVNPIPADWPDGLELAPLPDGPNDYDWYVTYRYHPKKQVISPSEPEEIGLSIVVPTFNRHRILDITLACLTHQKTDYPFEVIVADDGSKEELTKVVRKYEDKLDIKFVRQKDYGYQLCAVRNLGLRTAKYEYVSILDCDMAPGVDWVQSYLEQLVKCDDIALIGPRKYVDTHDITPEQVLRDSKLVPELPEVRTNSDLGNAKKGDISVDWRLEHFKKTEDLRLCDAPFRFFSGGNVAFSRKWLHKIGWFDEEFTFWGGEDNEFGYRLFRAGCFFKVIHGAMAYHQEPPGRENETDRAAGKAITIKIVQEKVPYFYRKLDNIDEARIHRVPLVSIYVPAYNCEDSITRCVDSALNQTVTDLEVCICDDGSKDNTLKVLKENYGDHPRVRFVSTPNGGIGSASNNAVKLCRGFYIGQLDSDDYLEPDAVENCLKEFLKDRTLACVYTGNRNVDPEGNLINIGYNWPEYSREKLVCEMICHHFRMFTARAFNLTEGFDEIIKNAVDYDIYLKLSQVGEFKHLNKIAYNRVLHGNNTSITSASIQKTNHFKVVNAHLEKMQKHVSVKQKTWKIHPKKEIGLKTRRYEFKRQHCLNDEFDQVYVVNLKSQVRKKYQISQQLKDMGVSYIIWEAVNGYEGDVLEHFNRYKERPLGALKKYKNFSEREIKRNSHFIESPGAFGYIYTYIDILKNALKNNYDKILIIEDDVIFSNDFENKFSDFLQRINADWAVLQLGASQYGWDSIDLDKAKNNGFYYPRRLDTCGSFAIGISKKVFQDIIEEQSFFDAPFDHLPMGEIYENNVGKCYVAFPNLVMPDVSTSTIREGRNQWEHALKMKWEMENFSYPPQKPRLNILATHPESIKDTRHFNSLGKLCDIGFFWLSEDGLRPVHGKVVVPDDYRKSVDTLNWSFFAPINGDWLAVREGQTLSETDLYDFLTKTELENWERSEKLIPISANPNNVVKNRASVIIPTHGDPLNLSAAIESALNQDYEDVEVIVVSDNGADNLYDNKIKEIINKTNQGLNTNTNQKLLRYIKHKENRNGAAARNTGILASTGEFIQFLDDDDIYLEGRISKAISVLKNGVERFDAVYCGHKGWNGSDSDSAKYLSVQLAYDIIALNYEKHYVHTNTVTYKRSALLAINGFDETYQRHQDLELNIRFLSHFTMTTCKEVLVHLRPKPKFVSYIPKEKDFILLKIKFLSDFSEKIKSFRPDEVSDIYKKHAEELRRIVKDESVIENELRSYPCEASFGLLYALSVK
jgi:chondroitin synthase